MPKYKLHQVHGMLLEEALAALLSRTGFTIVSEVHGDSTLTMTSSGLAVLGRGTKHQVDVIADFDFTPPFSYPPRLLLEAKFRSRRTGIDIVRNAVGMLRDVSEWFNPGGASSANRYHYQAAIFSKTPFTKPAQQYAYAHDIVLVPLENNMLFRPIVTSIASITEISDLHRGLTLTELRKIVRSRLLETHEQARYSAYPDARLDRLARAVNEVGMAFLARTSGGFPLFLIPDVPLDQDHVSKLRFSHPMRVRYDIKNGWRLELQETDRPISFSFDLPEELFHVFISDGHLDPGRAMDMKTRQFDQIHAFRRVSDRMETLVLRLDEPWAESVRHELESTLPREQ